MFTQQFEKIAVSMAKVYKASASRIAKNTGTSAKDVYRGTVKGHKLMSGNSAGLKTIRAKPPGGQKNFFNTLKEFIPELRKAK